MKEKSNCVCIFFRWINIFPVDSEIVWALDKIIIMVGIQTEIRQLTVYFSRAV